MQRTMEDFFRALRAADVRVSPAEAIDAHLAVAAVGYGDRELLRDALCATLAKSEEEVDRFEAAIRHRRYCWSVLPDQSVPRRRMR